MWLGCGSNVARLVVSALLLFAPVLTRQRPAARASEVAAVHIEQDTTSGRGDPATSKRAPHEPSSGRARNKGGNKRRVPHPPRQGERLDSGKIPANPTMWGDRATNYLVGDRGIDRSRIVVNNGGCRYDFAVELWIVPAGADDPPLKPTRDCGPNARLGADRPFAAFTKVNFLFAPLTRISPNAPEQRECPTVSVSCQDTAKPGERITFTAYVSGGDTSVTPTYNWTVSAGTVSAGQGTSSITVDTSLAGGMMVRATIDVGGFDRSCSTSSSCTTSLVWQAAARKIDEYGSIRFGDEQARLDNFAIELQNDPTARGFIIIYAPAR
jgi:hypothetical protein